MLSVLWKSQPGIPRYHNALDCVFRACVRMELGLNGWKRALRTLSICMYSVHAVCNIVLCFCANPQKQYQTLVAANNSHLKVMLFFLQW